MQLSQPIRFAIISATVLGLALAFDYYAFPEQKLRVEAFWIIGFVLLLALGAVRAIYPSLAWLSPTLFRSTGRPFSLRTFEWERCGTLPWVAISAGGLNVGAYGIGVSNPIFIVVRPQSVQRFGKHILLHARAWRIPHAFENWPEIHAAIKRLGFTNSPAQEVWFAPFVTLEADREYSALDLRGLSQRVISMADETRQLAREARQKVVAQIGLLKEVKK